MSAAFRLLAVLALSPGLWRESPKSASPAFSTDSIVNSANGRPESLAPNTLASIYGTNLSFYTQAVTPDNVAGGVLPWTLGGVRVDVNGLKAPLLFVSPGQVNFLIPADLLPGPATVRLAREGLAPPAVPVQLAETGPALFQVDAGAIAATHADGTLITMDAPAIAGQFVILYATGLGRTDPDQVTGRLSLLAAPIRHLSDLQVTLDGQPVAPSRVAYAGAAPGFPGLYQINVALPDDASGSPALQIAIGPRTSQAGLKLPIAAAPGN